VRLVSHDFPPELIERIRNRVQGAPGISRRQLSREICAWENWRSPNGRLKTQSCRQALRALHKSGAVELPDVKIPAAFQAGRSRNASAPAPEAAEVESGLDGLGGVEIILVPEGDRELSRIWNALFDRFHPRGRGPLCGSQIRYLFKCGRGWLGGISFSSAALRLKDRDTVIGWSEAAREANLPRVIANSRFLIVPTARVTNLASHLLSRCAKRIAGDWQDRYNIRPALIETFVSGEHSGACYQAANWIKAGATASRQRPFANGKVPDGAKAIYLFPLRGKFEWQKELCAEPPVRLGGRRGLDNPANWAEMELGSARLGNGLLRSRLFSMAMAFYRKPHSLIPETFAGDAAGIKAAYRFLGHRSTSMDVLLTPHKESAVARMKEFPVALSVQDTTVLNYASHPPHGAGPVNTKKTKAMGFLLHDTMAFSEQGQPLGLLDAQFWARDPEAAGQSANRRGRDIEEKESSKWLKSYRAAAEAQSLCPGTMVVSVGDREADIYELFLEAKRTPGGPKLLVRADKGRQRNVTKDREGSETYAMERLWDRMERRPAAAELTVDVPPRRGEPGRRARLEVRFGPVKLKPPKGKGDWGPIPLWAVYVKEIGCGPEVKAPLEWMLLTDVPTETVDDALRRIDWYKLRWGIEVYHRVLKSCCRVLDRRLGAGDRLGTCLALDMIVGWRIFWAQMLERETPDRPCGVFLEPGEWAALRAFFRPAQPLSQPPSCRDAVVMIARLGGYIDRKNARHPGPIHMARGFQRLSDIAAGYAMGRGQPP